MFDRIVIDPQICLGQPTVRGTRITISTILKMLANEHTIEEVLMAYPELDTADIYATMTYAAWAVSDHNLPMTTIAT